jgi:hypothetical protein
MKYRPNLTIDHLVGWLIICIVIAYAVQTLFEE